MIFENLYDYVKIYDVNVEDHLIDKIIGSKFKKSSNDLSENFHGDFEFYKLDDCENNPDYGILWSALLSGQLAAINEYKNVFPKMDISGGTSFVFRKYSVGNFVLEKSSWHPAYPTTLVFILNISDYDGGEILINEHKKFKLSKNQVMIFPSAFMYRYQHLPVTHGIKYTVESGIV